jgi:hypothetical protein
MYWSVHIFKGFTNYAFYYKPLCHSVPRTLWNMTQFFTPTANGRMVTIPCGTSVWWWERNENFLGSATQYKKKNAIQPNRKSEICNGGSKPELLTSELVDDIECKFNRANPGFWDLRTSKPMVLSECCTTNRDWTSKMAASKPELSTGQSEFRLHVWLVRRIVRRTFQTDLSETDLSHELSDGQSALVTVTSLSWHYT